MIKKATLDAKAFSEGLDLVSHVLKKSVIPQLSEVMVCIRGGRCTLTATDMETWLLREMPAEGDDFSFVFRRTKDVAKACRLFDGVLELELNDSGEDKKWQVNLLLRCGNRAGEVDTLDPKGYPEYLSFDAQASFSMNAKSLMERIGRVEYAALKSDNNSRHSSCKVSVQLSGNHVYALDGNRMSCDTDMDFTFPTAFMANAGSLTHLKLFGDKEIQIELGEKRGRFTDHTTTLDFRLNGTEFFKVENAIPEGSKEEFCISPKEFLRELKYLKEFTVGERHPYVRFHGGELFMPVSAGKYRTRVDIIGSNKIMFAFDLGLMMDALRQFKDAPQVKLKVTSAVSPFILEAEGRNDFALVCPARLSDRLMVA